MHMDTMRQIMRSAIDSALEATGYGPVKLAKELGIPYRQLWQWREGKRLPRNFDAVLEQLQAYQQIVDMDF